MAQRKYLRWVYLAIGTFVLSLVGIIYAWSILKGAFIDAFGWSNSDLSTAYTITISSFCLGCISCGLMLPRIGVRYVLLLSALFASGGFLVVSQMGGGHISLLYLGYGLFAGAGIGMAYNTILAIIGAWFPDKKGVSTGILMMGFGASTMIFGNLASILMEVPSFGWRKVFLALSVCIGAALFASAWILRLPAEEEMQSFVGSCSANAHRGGKEEGASMSPGQMIKRISFWKLFVAMTLLGSTGSAVISFARDLAISVGVALQYAGILVGVLSISNGAGRILTGLLYDKYGRKFIQILICLIEILSCCTCIATVWTGSMPLCILGFILVGLSFGANTCAISAMIGGFYGSAYYPQNLSLGLLTLLPSSFLAKLFSSLLLSTGGYVVPFLLMGICGVIALLLNLNNKEP